MRIQMFAFHSRNKRFAKVYNATLFIPSIPMREGEKSGFSLLETIHPAQSVHCTVITPNIWACALYLQQNCRIFYHFLLLLLLHLLLIIFIFSLKKFAMSVLCVLCFVYMYIYICLAVCSFTFIKQ